MKTLTQKREMLTQLLKTYNKVTVAFSGGIDSTLVLAQAIKVLGKDNVLAVVANSELFTDEEYDKAISLAHDLNATVQGITLHYLDNPHIAANEPESWYYSKKLFYQGLSQAAHDFRADAVLDGMIMDDLKDFRPGLVARDEAGAVSPLEKADFYKSDVREMAKELGLTNWNKVASCSISSRFPYYTTITPEKIQQVMASEGYLRKLGFETVRVRYHNEIARIEVPDDRLTELVAQHDQIQTALTKFGFKYVTIDLAGFKSGRMNDSLSPETKKKLMETPA